MRLSCQIWERGMYGLTGSPGATVVLSASAIPCADRVCSLYNYQMDRAGETWRSWDVSMAWPTLPKPGSLVMVTDRLSARPTYIGQIGSGIGTEITQSDVWGWGLDCNYLLPVMTQLTLRGTQTAF